MNLTDVSLPEKHFQRARAKGLPTNAMPTAGVAQAMDSLKTMMEKPLSTLQKAQVERRLSEHFCDLLDLEESQHRVDVSHLAIPDANVQQRTRDGNHYAILTVPGLSEKAPLVELGDCVRLRSFLFFGGDLATDHTSMVGRVQGFDGTDKLVLQVPESLPEHDHRAWTAEFHHNQVPFTLMRQACSEGVLDHLQYPDKYAKNHPGEVWSGDLVFLSTDLNPRQELAVRTALACQSMTKVPPQILFGPPGTGKTSVVCEMVWQSLVHVPDAKILCVAPSNAAADWLCQRLAMLHLPTGEAALSKEDLLRLNWLWRPRFYQKDVLLPYSKLDKKFPDVFGVPTRSQLDSARVIVSTCSATCMLEGKGLEFSNIFVDEASQALEPELYIALRHASDTTLVVIAGDHCQLGPAVRNRRCIDKGAGLDVSYQERLVTTATYRRAGSPHMVALTDNYRSHDRIIELPRALFYGGQLRSCADVRSTGSLAQWKMIPKEFPLLFYGVDGACMTTDDSASYFNPHEARQVYEMIEMLRKDNTIQVDPVKDIGVVAPYRAQVRTIRHHLRARGLRDVRVGNMDDYQGQEERIIIISTTLTPEVMPSSAEPLPSQVGPIAIFKSPRRFNVAITRAKALCIVIGHPDAVKRDQHWGSWLQFCKQHGAIAGYTGGNSPSRSNDPDAQPRVLGGGCADGPSNPLGGSR
eukprot:TRINITY_DN9119_c0_g1_i1.p1 TRINITY_DN9119_c0_g1~~TRINITY_DN9119_c0_g1_i1.p1  ORF type:complete len:694 (+),score=142.71 TRINITY_DN9119_c0_g1_i1:125-2206(+)